MLLHRELDKTIAIFKKDFINDPNILPCATSWAANRKVSHSSLTTYSHDSNTQWAVGNEQRNTTPVHK